MKIPAISTFGNFNTTYRNVHKNTQVNNRNVRQQQPCSFGAKYVKTDLLYKASIQYHQANIIKTNPSKVEEYFREQGISAFFREGSDFARKMVAYCSYYTSEIFSKLHYKKPPQIGTADFRRFGLNATGLCYYTPAFYPPAEHYPVRTVLFNTLPGHTTYNLDGKLIPITWENFFDICMDNKKRNFLSSGHFLSPFIHEFAHSLHNDKLFSKFGTPFYDPAYSYNPNAEIIFNKLNLKLDSQNPYVSSSIIKNINDNVSEYGSKLLPEAFAEAFTKAVLENIDIFSLKLIKNPFPMNNNGNKLLNQVLYETFEGLVGDGAGVI